VTDNKVRDNSPNLSSNLSTADNDGAWLSFPELARLRGINLTSAFRLARRNSWRRQKGNDGKLRVLVPAVDRAIDLDKDKDKGSREPDKGQDKGLTQAVAAIRSGVLEVVQPLQAAITVLEAQLTEANTRAARAESEVCSERVRADTLRDRLEATETRARDAEQAARIATDALNAARRAEEARKGRWALRRAWDGWRGR
jgi:chromosome segregation ATPase